MFECLLLRYGSAVDCYRSGALGAADLGMAKTLVEVTINPTIEPPELTQDWANRLLEGTNKTFHAPGIRRKEQ